MQRFMERIEKQQQQICADIASIKASLLLLTNQGNRIGDKMSSTSTALAALQKQVAENTSIESSAVQLIKGLADQVAAAVAANDTAALESLAAQLKATADPLAAAITANTPAPQDENPASQTAS